MSDLYAYDLEKASEQIRQHNEALVMLCQSHGMPGQLPMQELDAELTRLRAAEAAGMRRAAEIARRHGWPGSMSTERYAGLSERDEAAMDCADVIADAILATIPTPAPWTPPAWADVIAERRRQVEAEGWTPEHDDRWDRDELSAAAACYAYFGWVRPSNGDAPTEWPWDRQWWKPKGRRRDLVKAAALLLAEIERLDRLPPAPEAQP